MPTPEPDPKRPNRGPAAGPGNRAALIAAAREVYADDGLNAPFSAVAKRAGVGQGSLYRHFPDRKALAVAVFEENLIDLEEFTASPERTIDDLLDRVVAQAMVSTAFIDLITADVHDPRVAPLGIRFYGVAERLLARERTLGHVGAHVEVEDVMMATGMLATELARADPAQRPEVARRARALFRAAFAPR
ncbi:transcriptional regulator, TetR family [Microbacterium sp. cf046]|uniref:TetR/AcrR family transcriptional regulator n=1 Tax=Microbacterium sp. cf046 TaxID=1761803 RepID=UPI0008ECFDD9|nr:helix-turn-helix domain-containing protein [Microbacterium sp. cf046]SFR93706.1 transcriptional regulator, TetR family [Microbacterium sp. cf046]